MNYFEELTVGESDSVGAYEVTREEVTSFAEQYDPQAIHTDPEVAAASMFGGLVASGWHTAAMTMRLLVDGRLADSRALGALGVDSLRWPEPVRPGDTLSVRTEISETEVFDEERGRVAIAVTTTTQRGDTALTMVAQVLWERQ